MSRESDRIPDRSSKVPLEYVRVPQARIVQAIHLIRGHRVLLDADLAVLYEVETKALTRAVRRNQEHQDDDDHLLEVTECDLKIGICTRGLRTSIPGKL